MNVTNERYEEAVNRVRQISTSMLAPKIIREDIAILLSKLEELQIKIGEGR
jgi:energy-converting hydrogenase A subunit M